LIKNKRISWLVCSNGLGHLKRTFLISKKINEFFSHLDLYIYCEEWQVEAASLWDDFKEFRNSQNINFIFNKMLGSPKLPYEEMEFEAYLQWLEGLGNDEILSRSDMLLSDNLVGALKIREDSLLIGSFLWHDIILADSQEPEARKIAHFEKDLMSGLDPKIICQTGMAMEEIFRKCTPIEVPWMCDELNISIRKRVKNILILGGGTKILDKKLISIAKDLINDNNYEVFLPTLIYVVSTSQEFKEFKFNSSEFINIDLVICRPGIGTITDCIKYNIPVIALYDENNSEMRHNALMIESLGFGYKVSSRDYKRIYSLVCSLNDNNQYRDFQHSIKLLPKKGIETAVDYIIKNLNKV